MAVWDIFEFLLQKSSNGTFQKYRFGSHSFIEALVSTQVGTINTYLKRGEFVAMSGNLYHSIWLTLFLFPREIQFTCP